jgi:predicted lipoprotein with Yx(FWY)xxD motif
MSDPRTQHPDAQAPGLARRRLTVRVAISASLAVLTLVALPVLAAAAYAPPSPSPEVEAGQNQGGSGYPAKARVKERQIGSRTILTAANGHTLYSLSVEKGGAFVCTKSSGCLGIWHPLLIPSGATPQGPVKLGTVERPEGGVQVAFRGRPLYSFSGDMKPGQTNGNGLKDVGTWHPATVSTRRRH